MHLNELSPLSESEIAAINAGRVQYNEHERDRSAFIDELCAALNVAAVAGQTFTRDLGTIQLTAPHHDPTRTSCWTGCVRVDRYAGFVGHYSVLYKVRPGYKTGVRQHDDVTREHLPRLARLITKALRRLQVRVEIAVTPLLVPDGFEVWKQSSDRLYGWNWRGRGRKGNGYRTRASAVTGAIEAQSPCSCTFGLYCPHGRPDAEVSR